MYIYILEQDSVCLVAEQLVLASLPALFLYFLFLTQHCASLLSWLMVDAPFDCAEDFVCRCFSSVCVYMRGAPVFFCEMVFKRANR